MGFNQWMGHCLEVSGTETDMADVAVAVVVKFVGILLGWREPVVC